MQISAVQNPTYYTPVQPAPPVQPVKRDGDGDGDGGSGADDKVKAATPPGVGTRLDIRA